jgi:outer membrane protein OmpA-like peptidoglycan-associated protein
VSQALGRCIFIASTLEEIWMRNLFAGVVVLAVAGCATTPIVGKPPVSEYCNPCPMPCRSDAGCGKAVAAAPAPTPAPAPAPAPLPAAAATFDPAAGTYPSAQFVTLSTTTPGGVIHYTTDGSEPTAASPVYTAPIPVDASTTVRAIVTAPPSADSAVSSAAYAIEPPPPPPPAEPARVAIAKGKIELKEKVFFDTGKATIKPVSYGLLDEAAALLKAHPEVKRVTVEGHTDNRGAADFNTSLSQSRAEAVRTYLVGKGVEADRLDAKGFGPTRPIGDNKTAKGREENRRVEFTIEP